MTAIESITEWVEQRIKFHQDSIRIFRKHGRGMTKDIFISKGQIMEDEIIIERLLDIAWEEKKKKDLAIKETETTNITETDLLRITEESNFFQAQLDAKSEKLDQVMSIIDNHIQNFDDTFLKTHDAKIKETTHRTISAMRNLRKDIAKVLEKEE